MTALSANKALQSKCEGNIVRYLMKASTTIYAGGMVALDLNGLAVPAADTVGFKGVVGVATVKLVSAATGSSYITVQEGIFLVAGSSLAATQMGELVYVADDATVALSPGSTNLIRAGVLIEYVGASSAWVLVGAGVPKARAHVITLPVFALSGITDADVVSSFTPGYAGRVRKIFWVQGQPVTTGSKLTTLTTSIGSTAITGGVVALTSALCTPLGKIIAGSAVSALNSFDEDDTLKVVASSTTAFAEGSGSLIIVCEQF